MGRIGDGKYRTGHRWWILSGDGLRLLFSIGCDSGILSESETSQGNPERNTVQERELNMKRNRYITAILGAMIALTPAALAGGDIELGAGDFHNGSFNYQGYLEFEGAPANGNFYFRFSLFDSTDDWLGTWWANTDAVTVTDGLFDVDILMGDDPIIARQFWEDYGHLVKSMEIEVGQIQGFWTTLSPRVNLSSTPHALHALQSEEAGIANDLRFPYSSGLQNIASTMFELTSTSGQTVARFATTASNTTIPVVSIEGMTPYEQDFTSYNGVLRINTSTNNVGILSHARNFPILGEHLSGSSGNTAAILGEVSSSANPGIIAVWALNHASGNKASLGTGDYAADFQGDVLARNDLRIRGEPTRDYTIGSPSPIGPLAYASVSAGGTVSSGTANISSSWDAANSRYIVSVDNESMAFSTHTVSLTVVDAGGPHLATFIASSGDLLVTIWDIASGNAKIQDNFSIVIYDANPVVLNTLAVPNEMDLDKYTEETGINPVQTRPHVEPVEPFENYGSGTAGHN